MQFQESSGERRVGAIVNGRAHLLRSVERVYDLALAAIARRSSLAVEAEKHIDGTLFDYDRVSADGRLLPPVDHAEPARFLITGTGLTHLGSA
ncbi:MAG: AraD1 family protein, partial [Solimonas sp.]